MKKNFTSWLLLFLIFAISSWCEPSICLNMIVKDEAPVIEQCLASIRDLIDHWVIVDTGSTDGTQKIIQKYLADIPGELHERPWVNFAHNRNEALKLAKGKGDYLLFIDADEHLVISDFNKAALNNDSYSCFVRVYDREEKNKYFQGQRTLLVKNRLNWAWKGILHEYIACSKAKKTQLLKTVINFADSLEGHRTQDPLKPLKDAAVLEKILQEDPNNSRAIFYLAQSYAEAKKYQLALQNYEKRATIDIGGQEAFWSLFSIGQIQEKLQIAPAVIIDSYSKAFKKRPSRLEPLYYMALQYAKIGNPILSYALLKSGLSFNACEDGIFHETWIYDYALLFEFANAAFAIQKFSEALEAFESLLAKQNVPEKIRENAKNKILITKKIMLDLHNHGFLSF